MAVAEDISPVGLQLADSGIVAAAQSNVAAVDVTFASAPKAVSEILLDDALRPKSWRLLSADPNAVIPTVVQVEALDSLTFRLSLSKALSYPATYLVEAAPTIETEANEVPIICRCVFFDTTFAYVAPRDAVQGQSGDLANPQTSRDGGFGVGLGTYQINDRGDLALEGRVAGVRKRILRRAMTALGGFYHLPNYGFGQGIKEPLRPSALRSIAIEAKRQVELEPEVRRASVSMRQVPEAPNVVVMVIRAVLSNGLEVEVVENIPRGPSTVPEQGAPTIVLPGPPPSPPIGDPSTILAAADQLFWCRDDLGVVTPGSTVSDWADSSLGSWPLPMVQGTPSERPTHFASGGLNGDGYVRFTRVSSIAGTQLQDNVAPPHAPASVQPFFWVVGRFHVAPVATSFAVAFGTSVRQMALYSPGATFNAILQTSTGFAIVPGPAADTNWHLFMFWWDGSNLRLSVDNGTPAVSALGGVVDWSGASFTALLSGSSNTNQNTANFDLAECIATHAQPSAAAQTNMLAYLNNRYAQGW